MTEVITPFDFLLVTFWVTKISAITTFLTLIQLFNPKFSKSDLFDFGSYFMCQNQTAIIEKFIDH
jgi:hypothetical protein